MLPAKGKKAAPAASHKIRDVDAETANKYTYDCYFIAIQMLHASENRLDLPLLSVASEVVMATANRFAGAKVG